MKINLWDNKNDKKVIYYLMINNGCVLEFEHFWQAMDAIMHWKGKDNEEVYKEKSWAKAIDGIVKKADEMETNKTDDKVYCEDCEHIKRDIAGKEYSRCKLRIKEKLAKMRSVYVFRNTTEYQPVISHCDLLRGDNPSCEDYKPKESRWKRLLRSLKNIIS